MCPEHQHELEELKAQLTRMAFMLRTKDKLITEMQREIARLRGVRD